MENNREAGYLIAFAAIVGLIVRAIYSGYKQGARPASSTQSGQQYDGGDETILLSRRDWLIKDLLVALLLLGLWIIFTGNLADHSDDRISFSYLVCGSEPECASRSASDLVRTLDVCYSLSIATFWGLSILTFIRWSRTVALTGRLRLNKTALRSEYRPKLRLGSKLLFGIVCLLELTLIISTVRSNKAQTRGSAALSSATVSRSDVPPDAKPVALVGNLRFFVYQLGPQQMPNQLRTITVELSDDHRAYERMPVGVTFIDRDGFNKAFPGSVLIFNGLVGAEFQQLARQSPNDLGVQTTRALCSQQIPVWTFTDQWTDEEEGISIAPICGFTQQPAQGVVKESHSDVASPSSAAIHPSPQADATPGSGMSEVRTGDSAKVLYSCETNTHRIVISDALDGKLRYRAWHKPKSLSDTPDIDLASGIESSQGTGICSYPLYTFHNGNGVYAVQGALGCSDGSEPRGATGRLTVGLSGKQIADAWCY